MLIQVFISLFVIFAIWRLIVKFKKVELKNSEFWLWLLFWILAGVVAWLPGITTEAANLLGIGRGADLVFYVSLIVLFYLIFRIYLKLEKMERNITKLVRRDAIDNERETRDK